MKRDAGEDPGLRSEVVQADFFEKVGYSTVFEDERIVEEGLAPRPGERVLSITSGGDFSLQFLLAGAAEVLSIDFNPRQNYLLEFKQACAARLDHDAAWRVLGLSPCAERAGLYGELRPGLTPEARRYWDGQPEAVAGGVLRCGKQDRYLHAVGRVLTLLQGRRRVGGLFACRTLPEQQQYFDRRWNGPVWRTAAGLLFNRRILNLAFHKDHFRYARRDEHPATLMRRQAERVLRDVPIQENFYLHWLFFRGYADRINCPAWLRPGSYEKLRARLGRLRVHTGEVEKLLFEQPDRSVDCFNFSNIFDWVSEEAFVKLMGEVVRVARPGARLCYWTNTVNTRRELAAAARVHPRLREERERADRIFRACRTPGYSSCTIGVVQ